MNQLLIYDFKCLNFKHSNNNNLTANI
jgi:hypothetical protein